MIPDWMTTQVGVSDLLSKRHPNVFADMQAIFEMFPFDFTVVSGTKDIWIRDYGPVQAQENEFIQFRYWPDYLRRRHRHLITSPTVFDTVPVASARRTSGLIVDGGNVVGCSDTAILTDKIYSENPDVPQSEIRRQLQELLKVRRLIVIPKEAGDEIGHADGMVRFLDEHRVVVNDYRRVDPDFGNKLEQVLRQNGLAIERLPYLPENVVTDGIPSAVGVYVNYLRVGQVIVVPSFGLPEDDEARQTLAMLIPGARIESLPCFNLARQGGVLNCVTWTIQSRGAKPRSTTIT